MNINNSGLNTRPTTIKNKFDIQDRQQKAFNNNVSFQGNPAINVLSILEKNPILSLVTIDFFGMIMPRTIIELNRNKKELGHLNWDAGRESLLREALSSSVLFFVPGLAFNAMGKTLLNKKFNPNGLNTKLFADFNTLNIIENKIQGALSSATKAGTTALSTQALKENVVRSILDDVRAYSSTAGNPLKLSKELIEEVVKKAGSSTSLNSKEVSEFVGQFANKAAKHLKEAEVTVASNGCKAISTDIGKVVRDALTSVDDIVMKTAQGAKEINPSKFSNALNTITNSLKKLKSSKTIVAFAAAFGALLLERKFNLWLTHKLTGKKQFPGLAGLEKNSSTQEKSPKTNAQPIQVSPAFKTVLSTHGTDPNSVAEFERRLS